MKRTKGAQKLVMLIPLLLIVCLVTFPYIWTFLMPIKPTDKLYITNIKTLPRKTIFQSYVTLFMSTDFLASTFHSIVTTVIASCIFMLASFMASYASARYRSRGKNLILSGILLLYMFPLALHLTPLFVVFSKLKLIGFPVALVVSYYTLTISLDIRPLTSYIRSIPLELGEAGKIDGASVPQLLYYVVMPLLKPGFIATDTYVFISSWNEYLSAVIFTTSNNRTLPVSLASLVGEYDLRWDVISAGAVIAMTPVVILFMFI